jgi:2-polyprenyl-6-methoxyphenol hydroxylase-like FAD-dependent oxidoreductase
MPADEVLIIGAGVGGLCLAQGLARRGIPFRVFERDASLSSKSQGYRFRLENLGIEALERTLPAPVWELLERTRPRDSPADLLRLDARSGENQGIAVRARGATDRERRCYPIDRPWFRELLSLDIKDRIHYGKAFASCETVDDDGHGQGRVKVTFTDGATAEGRLLVAADGVHSRVRKARLPDHRHLDVERTTMWGRTPLTAEFEARLNRPDVLQEHFAFMVDARNPARSCLFAPIRWQGDVGELSGGRLSATCRDYVFWALNFEAPEKRGNNDNVNVNDSPETRARYALEVSREWNPDLRVLFEMQDVESLYAVNIVSSKPDLPRWETDPRVTFLGDAIHATSPSGGSGGLTTVQDVADLCDALDDSGLGKGDVSDARLKEYLRGYEDKMRARAKTAIEYSFMGGKMIWAAKEWHEYSEVRDL